MRYFLNFIAIFLIAINYYSDAAENAITNDSPTAQKELWYKRFLKEMQQGIGNFPANLDFSFTNAETQSALRAAFESVIVDPPFGLQWDEVPAPTLVDSNAISAVNAFVATNGWNMQTNNFIFDCISDDDHAAKSKPICGLPWAAINKREFPAVTHNGSLFVFFGGFHHDGSGVAYNPQTNNFAATIDSFKPIGQHWYAWAFDHESPIPVRQQIYEGAKAVKVLPPAAK